MSTKNYAPEIEIKELPSQGSIYPENWTVTFHPFSFGEINKINFSDVSLSKYYQYVLEGINCSFPKEKLTFYDFQFLALSRKIGNLGDLRLSTTYECVSCGENQNIIFKHSDLEFIDIVDKTFPYKYTIGDKEYSFSLLTIDDYFKLAEKKAETDRISVLAQICTESDKDQLINTFNNEIPVQNMIKALDDIEEYTIHGVKPFSTKCTKCNEDILVDILGVDTLILPFRS